MREEGTGTGKGVHAEESMVRLRPSLNRRPEVGRRHSWGYWAVLPIFVTGMDVMWVKQGWMMG